MFDITDVMSEEECYVKLRQLRWPEGTVCPHCKSAKCTEIGSASRKKPTIKYNCDGCGKNFNDLTGTIFRSSNLSLKKWIFCLYLMNLNISNAQIAKELGVSERTANDMCCKLRSKVYEERPQVVLSDEVELDEVYVVAGHKGNPEAVKKRVEKAAEEGLKALEAEEH